MTAVSETFGALLLGAFFAIFLSGTVFVMCYIYFRNYPRDSPRTKALVAIIWALDSFHSCFVVASLWQYLISNYGRKQTIDHIPTTLALSIACTAIVTISVHCFFAHRIYLISRGNLYLTMSVLVLAVFRLSAASVTTGEMIRLKSFTLYKEHYRWVFTIGLGLSSTVDVLITASLCYFLRVSRSKSSKLNAIIDSLFLYTFENGAVTSAATIASMICWLTMPSNLIFMGLHFVIGKLYASSFLATLHARQNLRQRRSVSTGAAAGVSTGPSPVTFLGADNRPRGQQLTPKIVVSGLSKPSASASSSPSSDSSLPSKMEISVVQTVQCNIDDRIDECSEGEDHFGDDSVIDPTRKVDKFVMHSRRNDLESGMQ